MEVLGFYSKLALQHPAPINVFNAPFDAKSSIVNKYTSSNLYFNECVLSMYKYLTLFGLISQTLSHNQAFSNSSVRKQENILHGTRRVC